jgi:hypothetical protein
MNKLDEFPEALGQLDGRIQVLRELVEKKADASKIGNAVSQLYLDWMNRIVVYHRQLDLVLGYQLVLPHLTIEQNLPRATTALRMFGQITEMLVKLTDGLLRSVGGPPVIAFQQLGDWAKADPSRQEFFLAALDRGKRSRK